MWGQGHVEHYTSLEYKATVSSSFLFKKIVAMYEHLTSDSTYLAFCITFLYSCNWGSTFSLKQKSHEFTKISPGHHILGNHNLNKI